MGANIRSKATWYEKREKSNKYFLNLESHRKTKCSIRESVAVTDSQKDFGGC